VKREKRDVGWVEGSVRRVKQWQRIEKIGRSVLDEEMVEDKIEAWKRTTKDNRVKKYRSESVQITNLHLRFHNRSE
jgi:hypothetical protein